MSKISTRLGAVVALAAGASVLASGAASFAATGSPHAPQKHTAPDWSEADADSGKEDGDKAPDAKGSSEQTTKDCIDMGKTKDAFFAMQGVHLDYPLVGGKREDLHDIVVDPICAALTYGPFSAYKGQQAPTNVTVTNPGQPQKPDDKPDDPSFPISSTSGPLLGHAGIPATGGLPTSNPFAGQTAQSNPLGGLLPAPNTGSGSAPGIL